MGQLTLQKPDVARNRQEILAFRPRIDARGRESVQIALRDVTNATAATEMPEHVIIFVQRLVCATSVGPPYEYCIILHCIISHCTISHYVI